jgi:transcriptional regulator with XRE-family HTH domain
MIKNSLKKFREAAGLTQADLASKAGISLAYVRTLEQSGANPGIDVGRQLADALGVESDRIFSSLGQVRIEILEERYPEPLGVLLEKERERLARILPLMDNSMWKALISERGTWADVWHVITAFDNYIRAYGGGAEGAIEKSATRRPREKKSA